MAHWDIRIEFETPKNNKYYAVGFLGEGETPENTEEVVRRIKEAGHRVAKIPNNTRSLMEMTDLLPKEPAEFRRLLFYIQDEHGTALALAYFVWYPPLGRWFCDKANPVDYRWGTETLVLCDENPTSDSAQAEDPVDLRSGFQAIPPRFPRKFYLSGLSCELISVYPENHPPETCGDEIRKYGICRFANTGAMDGVVFDESRHDLPAEYREEGFNIAFPCWHGPGKWGGPPSPHSFYCLIYNEGQWNLRTVKSDQKLGPKCFLVKCLG